MNFAVIFIGLGVVALVAAIYFVTRFHKFSICRRIEKKSKLLAWLAAFVPVIGMGILAYFSTFTTIVIILHLFIIWLIADLIGYIIKKITKKTWKVYWQGIGAILFFLAYITGGYYVAHNVMETDYTIEAVNEGEKVGEKLRIAMIADAHISATFDGEGFAKHVKTIQETEPDLLVIVGDFVDDDSKRVDMEKACAALGELKTKYGVYFVFGNHDRGYFTYRDFTATDLVEELEKNGVTILEDEIVPIGEKYQLIGRQDKSRSRADIATLMTWADSSKYSIVLDHQPNDFEAESKTSADLVLTGHTHGGWLFPMAYISSRIGPDDRIYGMEKRNNTNFIVTSGISDWNLPIKTGTKSEFVIIDLE